MKILHKYVLKEHFGPLTFALAALTSILLLNYVAKQFGMLVGKGLPWTVIAEFFALSIPFTVALTLPMAVLVATLYAFSRFVADNEITALKASGVGMVNVLRPVLLASIVVTAIMLFFNDQILPRTNHTLAVLQTDIAQTKPTFALREQVINEVSPGKLYLRANHIDPGSSWMREVTIYDLGDATRRRTIYADSGTLAMASNRSDLLMVLYSGMMQDVPTSNPAELQRLFFDRDAIRVAAVANQFRKSTGDPSKGNREMSVCEMQRDVDKAREDYQRARDIFESGMQRSRTFHLKLDPSLTAVHLASTPKVTLGGVYCKLIGAVNRRISGAEKTGAPAEPPAPVRPVVPVRPATPVVPPVRVAPQTGSATTTAGAPSMHRVAPATHGVRQTPVTPSVPQGVIPHPLPERRVPPVRGIPAPGGRLPFVREGPGGPPALRTPYPPGPGVRGGGGIRPWQQPHLFPNGKPPKNMPPAVARLMFQQAQARQQAQQQTVMPAGLEAERVRLMDLQLLIDSNEVEIHKKFALAVACFVFVLLGAPIALRFPRAGVGLTIGVSLVVFALYYVGLIAGASLGSRGIIPPWVSMWAPNAIFGVAGAILVGRMNQHGGAVRGGGSWEWLDVVASWVRRHIFGVKSGPEQPQT